MRGWNFGGKDADTYPVAFSTCWIQGRCAAAYLLRALYVEDKNKRRAGNARGKITETGEKREPQRSLMPEGCAGDAKKNSPGSLRQGQGDHEMVGQVFQPAHARVGKPAPLLQKSTSDSGMVNFNLQNADFDMPKLVFATCFKSWEYTAKYDPVFGAFWRGIR